MRATVKYAFRESRAGAGAPKRLRTGCAPGAQERVPRVARLLALAHKFQGMLDRGEVKSMAELARVGRVSRARITQIMDLMMLAPDIQEEILDLPLDCGRDSLPLRDLRAVCQQQAWADQRLHWRAVAQRMLAAA